MAEGKQYFTVKDVFDATVKLAKADPYFEQYNKICVLDYDLILRDCEDGTLYRAEFGVLGDVSYAFVDRNGDWTGSGDMGWFGISSNDKDERAWNDEIQKLMNEAKDDDFLAIVDCHI